MATTRYDCIVCIFTLFALAFSYEKKVSPYEFKKNIINGNTTDRWLERIPRTHGKREGAASFNKSVTLSPGKAVPLTSLYVNSGYA
jgi:hypothetical protein